MHHLCISSHLILLSPFFHFSWLARAAVRPLAVCCCCDGHVFVLWLCCSYWSEEITTPFCLIKCMHQSPLKFWTHPPEKQWSSKISPFRIHVSMYHFVLLHKWSLEFCHNNPEKDILEDPDSQYSCHFFDNKRKCCWKLTEWMNKWGRPPKHPPLLRPWQIQRRDAEHNNAALQQVWLRLERWKVRWMRQKKKNLTAKYLQLGTTFNFQHG